MNDGLEEIVEVGITTAAVFAVPAFAVLAGHSFDMGWCGLGIGSMIAALWAFVVCIAAGRASEERGRR